MVDATAGADTATPAGRDRWPRAFRWTAYVAVALVVLLLAATLTGVVIVRRSWPQTTGTLKIDGLDAKVQVVRDAHGIPQIYAGTMHDLMLAQGYVAAQERFFEMDVRRHATAGRLSELFGEAGLETDLVTRTLGWRRVARQELTMLDPATRDALDAYAQGVNDYLAGRPLSRISLEYSLLDVSGLDYHPEKWSAIDSISWLKAMAWDLRGNIDDEIARAMTTAAVGSARAAQLFPSYDYVDHPSILGGAGQALTRPGSGPVTTGQKPDGVGSNGWVVSGALTTTGAPILANDPHLSVSVPGVWMQVGLHCTEITDDCPLDVAGFSFSGLPGVVIGHNAHIAWGFTNLGADVSDLYVERLRGDRWQHGGRSLPLTTRTEHVKVRGGADVTFEVRSTAHGPLLSDVVDLAQHDKRIDLADDGLLQTAAQAGADVAATLPRGRGWSTGVSLAWTALQPRPTADAILALDGAADWSAFHRALRSFAVPGQNVVYADTAGHIGYQATGLVPIRRDGDSGLAPVAGWLPRNDWTGRFVPYERLPRVLDPKSGMIVTANQAVTDPGYPYRLTDDWDRGYRSTRIGERLRQATADGGRISVATMTSIQNDDVNPMAKVLLPYLLRIRLGHGYDADGQRLLASWNGGQDPDSAAAAYFNVVWRELLHRTFADELPKAVQPDGSSRWFDVVTGLLQRPDDRWWDDLATDEREGRDDILAASMRAARDDLTRLESPDANDWSWGAIHRLDLRSSTFGESGIAPIEWLFNRGGWRVGGGGSLVDATAWDARHGYAVTTAPSMRMVVPLDDLDKARWINLTGVSGHAFDPHYTDQTELWAEGETLPWSFTRTAVDKAHVDVLTLEPDGD